MTDDTADADPQPDADGQPPLLREVYPDLSAELISLLNADGHTDLGICAHDLRIVAACSCGDDFCQSLAGQGTAAGDQ